MLRTVRSRLVQTNVARRALALRLGLASIAASVREPITLIEVGASAGILLRFDDYEYRIDGRRWGPADSPVRIETQWRGADRCPDLGTMPRIGRRIGIDLHPVDARDPEERAWLRALVWPENGEQAELLTAALRVVAERPVPIVAGDAVQCLPQLIRSIDPGSPVVLFHAATLAHVPPGDRAAFTAAIEHIGRTQHLFHLSLEGFREDDSRWLPAYALDLTEITGPKRTHRRLGRMDGHGAWFEPVQRYPAAVQRGVHMPVSAVDRARIITRLRAAGCVFAEDEADLLIGAAAGDAAIEAMVAQRVDGLPLEHILGWAEFCGMRIAVAAGVFVPRRRTEFLVEQAAMMAGPGAVVLDLCCGSGALGAALAARTRGIELYASDVEPAAIRCAQQNLEGIGTVFGGDLFAPLPGGLRGRVDILLANVPYVPAGAIATMPPEARDHEPRVALDGGADGLEVLRRVSAEASSWLAPGGSLLSETSEEQAAVAEEILRNDGLAARTESSPDVGATIVIGTKSQAQ